MDIDVPVRTALTEFAAALAGGRWRGRENEAVNLFALGYLARQIHPGRTLHDLTQIGIEVAVPQLAEPGRKRYVRKDLVIWPRPRMNCWCMNGHDEPIPLAVIEWKVNRTGLYQRDVEWLQRSSGTWPTFVGYAVTVDLRPGMRLLHSARAHQGSVDLEWLIA